MDYNSLILGILGALCGNGLIQFLITRRDQQKKALSKK